MNKEKNSSDLSVVRWGTIKETPYEVAILPWGAIEPHNYHLPYATDCILSQSIALDCARKASETAGVRCMVMPPIYLGSQNPGQWNKPFCIHARSETQKAIMTDIVSSLYGQGFRKLLLINGHGGNTFKSIVRDLAVVYPDFYIVSVDWFAVVPTQDYFEEIPDEHAGEQETSVMLHYHPEYVDMEMAGDGEVAVTGIPSIEKKIGWMPRNWDEVSRDTGIGNPKKSTAEKGRRYVEAVISRIVELLDELNRV